MPLNSFEITLDLNWRENCVIMATNVEAEATTSSVTDTKPYVTVVNSSI